MEKNKEKTFVDFIGIPENEEDTNTKNDKSKKVVLDERSGLIERVDKILITKDGKQLLREQY